MSETAGPAGAGGIEAPASDDWAVCCSGGGIRSAAYCLGALQSLDEGGLLAKAKWVLGVSGGSYVAASRALVARYLAVGTCTHAYAPGTPEERSLRYDTRYIGPDWSVLFVGVMSLFLGAMGVFVIVVAPLYAVAHAWGWLLRWQDVAVPAGPVTITATVTQPGWWLPPVVAAGIGLILFGYWRASLGPGRRRTGGPLAWLRPDDRDRGTDRAWLAGWAVVLAAGLALAMLAAPLLISWLTTSTGALGTVARFFGFGARPSWSWSATAGLIAAVTAIGRYCQAILAKTSAAAAAVQGGSAAGPGLGARLTSWIRQLLPWAASAAIVAGGAVLALLWTSDGARAGFSAGQVAQAGIALAVTLLSRVAVDVNRLSMHDFYRWRLADAFAVTREAAEAAAKPGHQTEARSLFAKAAATRLSQLGPCQDYAPSPGEAGLVICGTANINAVREVPAGQGGFCLTFDPQHVALHREKGLAAPKPAQARTSDYEGLAGYSRFTLFDVSAISGAAISPLMGAATRRAYRILFTAANLRLGVWLPHPAVIRNARELIDDPDNHPTRRWWEGHPLLLLAWYLCPHALWDNDKNAAGHGEMGRDTEREARLWAHVLQLRLGDETAEQGKARTSRRKKWSGALWYRLMQPTLGLLWDEAAGDLSYRSTWMYVTDGGHYDNLGLVEALRRGASHIVVLDASGDKADTWFTLGGAIALARADAGVEIDIDPTRMIQGGGQLAPGQVVRPWAYGRFRRLQEDCAHEQPAEGEIWVCKLGWWDGAPWDIRAYAKQHSAYPCDSTLEQLYDVTEFSAYQELGAAAVRAAAMPWSPSPLTPLPLPLTDPLVDRAADGRSRPAMPEPREPGAQERMPAVTS